MLGKIKGFGKDKLVMGSLILFIMMNVFNLLNYFFQFSMARMLGPADYGVLAALMSLIYIFTIPNEAIQTIVSRYTSKYSADRKPGKIKSLFVKSVKRGIQISFLLFIVYIPIAYLLSGFLKINFWLLVLTGGIIFALFIVPVNRGILQGNKRFAGLGWNMVIEGIFKVGLSILLVFIGFKIYGAVLGMLIALILAFFIGFCWMKNIIKNKAEKIDSKVIYSYGKPVLLVMISLVLMYSLDMILAKRFFSPEVAGQYAVASMFGKMIFFGTMAIGKAMFPFASENYETGKNTSKLLEKSIKMTLLVSLVALLAFLVFPKLLIGLFFGSAYIEAASILFTVGFAFTFLSIGNILLLYSISTNQAKRFYFLFIFVILQIVLLSLFHSSLYEFSIALLVSNALMLIYSLISTK